MELDNNLLLKVAKGESVSRPPIWLMRQAGRFLSEYRAVRAKAGSFRNMISNPAYAAEVTIQPVDLVGVDAAIIFSDILVIPEAMGLPYEMIEKKGPFFPKTIRNQEELKKIHAPDSISNLNHTYEAIEMVKEKLEGRVPLIGFAGAPFTIFCYMTEGSGSKTFSIAKRLLYTQPEFSHDLLQKITDSTISYLKGQIKSGVDIVQIFDSWAGILGAELFNEFALPYISKICEAITEVPVITFAKGVHYGLKSLDALNCEVIGLDWTISPEKAQESIKTKAFQGNMDPCLLYSDPKKVSQAALKMINSFPKGRHIVNLGHGIYPDLPRESVIELIKTVKSFQYDS